MSSTRIVTFERSLPVNQLLPGEVVGAVAEGEAGRWSYRGAVFSGSIKQEFTRFERGVGVVAGVKFALPLVYPEGCMHLDYLFNDGDLLNNALKPYDHVLSLGHQGRAVPAPR